MAELIVLEHREQPPANAEYVLVDQDPSRGITGPLDMMLVPPGLVSAAFYVVEPFGEGDWRDAIEKAKRYADDKQIAEVYVSSRVPAALKASMIGQ